ncbi:hypothetical protein HNY73_005165 [Argiope bruennichi]|uniref:Uncharacterized protein n=1 Tax=Argiope bruennichi TaxID=94029 RepID=A0A8T0FL34_ARGBR|nr:hypothetical protein HNY73_005165 [Argiope bruennichi]
MSRAVRAMLGTVCGEKMSRAVRAMLGTVCGEKMSRAVRAMLGTVCGERMSRANSYDYVHDFINEKGPKKIIKTIDFPVVCQHYSPVEVDDKTNHELHLL